MRSALSACCILLIGLTASAQQMELELAFEESPNAAPAPAEEPRSESANDTMANDTMEEPVPAPTAEPDDEPTDEVPLPAATGATPQRFSPTEEVRADFSVSFPTDI